MYSISLKINKEALSNQLDTKFLNIATKLKDYNNSLVSLINQKKDEAIQALISDPLSLNEIANSLNHLKMETFSYEKNPRLFELASALNKFEFNNDYDFKSQLKTLYRFAKREEFFNIDEIAEFLRKQNPSIKVNQNFAVGHKILFSFKSINTEIFTEILNNLKKYSQSIPEDKFDTYEYFFLFLSPLKMLIESNNKSLKLKDSHHLKIIDLISSEKNNIYKLYSNYFQQNNPNVELINDLKNIIKTDSLYRELSNEHLSMIKEYRELLSPIMSDIFFDIEFLKKSDNSEFFEQVCTTKPSQLVECRIEGNNINRIVIDINSFYLRKTNLNFRALESYFKNIQDEQFFIPLKDCDLPIKEDDKRTLSFSIKPNMLIEPEEVFNLICDFLDEKEILPEGKQPLIEREKEIITNFISFLKELHLSKKMNLNKTNTENNIDINKLNRKKV